MKLYAILSTKLFTNLSLKLHPKVSPNAVKCPEMVQTIIKLYLYTLDGPDVAKSLSYIIDY